MHAMHTRATTHEEVGRKQQNQNDDDNSKRFHPTRHNACLQIHRTLEVNSTCDTGHGVQNYVNEHIERNVRY